ncbi:glutamate ligase domain-containing protein, partial [Steroidobacter agaridevorans]
NIQREGVQTRFDVERRGSSQKLSVQLNLPGRHNVLNSLAAIAVAKELEVSDAAIQSALASFHGVDRRLQQYGDVQTSAGKVTIIDDYGHHPTELAATLEAIRQGWPNRRILLAFQPHRYSRTRDLLDDFARVLAANADALIVTEVYAAGETPIAGADGKAICRAVRSHGRVEPVFVDKIDELPRALIQIARDGDVIVTMGAGSIGSLAPELPAALTTLSAERRQP